jgi:S1-C subfamily serine protease
VLSPGGPAAKAGINVRYIVLAVNEIPFKELADFFQQIRSPKPASVKVLLRIPAGFTGASDQHSVRRSISIFADIPTALKQITLHPKFRYYG